MKKFLNPTVIVSTSFCSSLSFCLSPLCSGHTESLCSAMRWSVSSWCMCPGRPFPVWVLVSSYAQACPMSLRPLSRRPFSSLAFWISSGTDVLGNSAHLIPQANRDKRDAECLLCWLPGTNAVCPLRVRIPVFIAQ